MQEEYPLSDLREAPEVTMLVIACGNELVLVLDPAKPKRGWTFPSVKVPMGVEPQRAAVSGALRKIGYDARGKHIAFIKAKTRGGIRYSSFLVELAPQEFAAINQQGPEGHSIRKVEKGHLKGYLDRGRFDMIVSSKTDILG